MLPGVCVLCYYYEEEEDDVGDDSEPGLPCISHEDPELFYKHAKARFSSDTFTLNSSFQPFADRTPVKDFIATL